MSLKKHNCAFACSHYGMGIMKRKKKRVRSVLKYVNVSSLFSNIFPPLHLIQHLPGQTFLLDHHCKQTKSTILSCTSGQEGRTVDVSYGN